MKAILLAAGMGERLRPYTEDRPKCMVKVWGNEIIAHQIASFRSIGINDLTVVGGYRGDALKEFLSPLGDIRYYENIDFDKTNMTWSLFCARREFDDDLIISYTDIIFNSTILRALTATEEDFSVTVDSEWQKLWALRQEDPINDAETMKIDPEGYITELGRKPKNLIEIEGQYMGLFKWSRSFAKKALAHYNAMDREALYDGKDFPNMYMTSFLQGLIDNVQKPKAVLINGGWIEIDTTDDLDLYQSEKFSSQKKKVLS